MDKERLLENCIVSSILFVPSTSNYIEMVELGGAHDRQEDLSYAKSLY